MLWFIWTCIKMYYRNLVMFEKFQNLDLCLDTIPCSFKVYFLSFPSSHYTLGASLLYRNIVTILLSYRYSLVFSNPSKFSLEKWRFKLTPYNFSLCWVGNAPLPLKKSVTQVSTSPDTWVKRSATVSSLTVRIGAPLAPPIFFIGGVVLEFSRKKEKLREASRS